MRCEIQGKCPKKEIDASKEEEIDTSIDWIAMAEDSVKPEYEANAS